MTEPTATTEPEICCGEHKPSNKGKTLVEACQLCPRSSTYWRNEPGAKARLADQDRMRNAS